MSRECLFLVGLHARRLLGTFWERGLNRSPINTISKYLEQSAPVRRSYRRRERPVWARVQARVEELVAE